MSIKISTLLSHNTALQDDPNPELGGTLNTNGFSISNSGNPVIIAGNVYPATHGSPGQSLVTDGNGNLYFETISPQTITLSGDVTGSGLSSITTTLTNTSVTPSTYGSASVIPTFVVDSKGRLTYASNVSILITPAQSGLGNVVNSLQVINLGGVPNMSAGAGAPVSVVPIGTLYIDSSLTNGNSIYRYNGSNWIPITKSLTLFAENPVTPILPVSTGTNAVALGSSSISSATDSFSMGTGAKSSIYGQRAYANGYFTSAGDAQHGIYVMRNITTDASSSEMFLDGPSGSQRLILPPYSVFTFTITISARRTDATDGAAGYEFKGIAKRDSTTNTIVFVGNPSKTLIGEINTEWDSVVSTDVTHGSIKIQNIGQVGKTIRWVATILTTEVTN